MWIELPADRRQRREILWCFAFVASCLLIPPVCRELYPYSSFHGFVDSARQYARYAAIAPDGRRMSTAALGLHRNYYGNGGYSVNLPEPHRGGVALPPTLDVFGDVPSETRVTDQVIRRLEGFSDLPYVTVVQEVVGDDGRGGVGVVRRHEWTIDNPHFAADAP